MGERVVILGAAGRDFHEFNVRFRSNPDVEVVAFTATQIPDIDDRRYPPELAGDRYPDGIPIVAEDQLERLIDERHVDRAVFAYSDVSHEYVMHLAARATAAGAVFELPGGSSMLRSVRPVVSVTAARTGAGKSQTSRAIRRTLADAGRRVAAIRHPMPYGNLVRQRLQRFATFEDLDAAEVTIEEREEYEPYLAEGAVIFAGADYEAILRAAEEEADVIVWDGGNNDAPFIRPDVDICVLDPHRAGHELRYWPGEANLRRAGVVIINKVRTADPADLETLRANVAAVNPDAVVVEAASPVSVDDPAAIAGKRVLIVEDGPTITHGEMAYGAGWVAAREHGAAEIVDPRPYAVGSIVEVFERYGHIRDVLPAMGYGDRQRAELRETILATGADLVIVGTPIDLMGVLDLDVPAVRIGYDLEIVSGPSLEELLAPVS
ncbi:MAG TPA: GTPase [Acidimicrobiia bacterium]|nr:GTPase [Acidimicrobiia bacterium]